MEKENSSKTGDNIDIRYNKVFAVLRIIVGIGIIIMLLFDKKDDGTGYELFIKDKTDIILAIFLLPFLLYLADGFYALLAGRYARLDKQAKTVYVYTFFNIPLSKYKYDRLFFDGKALLRVIDGKKKLIAIIRHQCRKDDYETFVNEINKEV